MNFLNLHVKNQRGEIPALVAFGLMGLVILVVLAGITGPRLIGSEARISISSPFTGLISNADASPSVGKSFALTIQADNADSGVCSLKVAVFQGTVGKVIYQGSGKAGSWLQSWSHPWTKQVTGPESEVDLSAFGFQEGDAELQIEVEDCSLWHHRTVASRKIKVDLAPPAVSVTSTQHYINQGGAELATYTVSSDAVDSGIRIGTNEFHGFVMPGATQTSPERFVIFVYSYDLPANTPITVFARDAAGNIGTADLIPAKFFPKEFRHREIQIDDKFIDSKVADIIAHTPGLSRSGNNLKDFLTVNRDLRKTNAAFFHELTLKTAQQFYWIDAFRPLTNAAVEASFADYRDYIYQGEKVDQQVHLGFDLAVVEHNPIQAAANGVVLFADYLGIYGNTIILDHGYGLITLYAHLSSMDVAVGDVVQKDQKIANSGATGMAGGDHLHFSMLIQGVQTNPIEFWDQHWIDDHIYLRVNRDHFGKLPAATNPQTPAQAQ